MEAAEWRVQTGKQGKERRRGQMEEQSQTEEKRQMEEQGRAGEQGQTEKQKQVEVIAPGLSSRQVIVGAHFEERTSGSAADLAELYADQTFVHSQKRHLPLRVAAYCRVSTDREEQLYSYQQQKEYYSSYILKNGGWSFVGIYADRGLSGTSTKSRKEFNRMMEDAAAGRIDYILVKSVSRFARNTVDALYSIRWLKTLKPPVGVYFEKERIDTLDSCGELILTIMSALAQAESRSISDNERWAVQKRFQAGRDAVNLSCMLGYDRGEKNGWVINQEQAETVRLIYRLYLEGMGTKAIAGKLTELARKTGRGNTHWQSGAVYRILTNEAYTGDIMLQKSIVKDFFSHQSMPNDGRVPSYYIKDHHPPIIAREIWEAVQSERIARKGRADRPEKQADGSKGKWPMSARLRCACCGELLIRRCYHVPVRQRKNRAEVGESGGHFTCPAWRCAAAERRRNIGCRERSYLEFSLQQSFMEHMYLLRKEILESLNPSESSLARAFADAMAKEQVREQIPFGAETHLTELEKSIHRLEQRCCEIEEHPEICQEDLAADYQSILHELTELVRRKRRKYQSYHPSHSDRTERKERFRWLIARLLALPAESPAHTPWCICGIHTPGNEQEGWDILPFDEELYRRLIAVGTVMPDGRIVYQTHIGLPMVIEGNQRRFHSFYGCRRYREDGTVQILHRAEEVADAEIKTKEKKA